MIKIPGSEQRTQVQSALTAQQRAQAAMDSFEAPRVVQDGLRDVIFQFVLLMFVTSVSEG